MFRDRPASLLPTVKCSNCADEIAIADMGDHTCRSPELRRPIGRSMKQATEPLAITPTSSASRLQDRIQQKSLAGRSFSKPSRVPNINSEIANKSYARPNYPLIPGDMSTNQASLLPGITRPPSPELSANLDCAFPPFPTSAVPSHTPSQSPLAPKVASKSLRAPPRSASRLDAVLPVGNDISDITPKSPRLPGPEQVLRKMQVLQAGPFTEKRNSPDYCVKYSTSFSQEVNKIPQNHRSSLPSSDSERAVSSHDVKDMGDFRSEGEIRAVEAATTDGETIHDPMSATCATPTTPPILTVEISTSASASMHPTKDVALPVAKDDMPAVVAFDCDLRSPNSALFSASVADAPQLQGSLFPPRKDSASGSHTRQQMGDAYASTATGRSQGLSGLHTPSDSESSTRSSGDQSSDGHVTISSPAESTASSLDSFQRLKPKESWDSGYATPPVDLELTSSSLLPGMRAEQSMHRWPSKKFTRPDRAERPADASTAATATIKDLAITPMLTQGDMYTEPQSSTNETSGNIYKATQSGGRWPDVSANSSTDEQMPPLAPSISAQSKRMGSKRSGSSKSSCRGCKQLIDGKSVKAADGRLSGRWHKSCFVCRCCRAPFLTADFYVFMDEPYCEQHYHENNGSLCGGCHKGIEGQYLETSDTADVNSSRTRKFHPRCFTCTICRMVLSADYFEIEGRIHCERHALAAMRSQTRLGLGNNLATVAERRTTRLINPMIA